MSYPRYELDLQLINDIIEKVPEDRWDALCADLPEMLRMHKSTTEAFRVLKEIFGDDIQRKDVKTFHWVDDGNTSTTVEITQHFPDGTSTQTKLNSKELFKDE